MAKSYLIEYVRTLVERGYSYDAVRNYLIQQGNPQNEVDSAINSHYNELMLKEQAYIQQLVLYIQRGMNQGYSKDWMRSQLIQQGISARFIDNAFEIIEKPERKFDIGSALKNKTALVMIVLLLAGFFGLLVFKTFMPEPTLLDLTASAITSEVEAGKELIFSFDVISQGTRQKYDIFLEYTVVNPLTKEIVVRGKETFAISTTLSKVRRLLIPEDTSTGNYELVIVASYDNKIAKTIVMFRVSGETRIDVPEEPEKVDDEEVEDIPEEAEEIDDRFGDGVILVEYEEELPERPVEEEYVEIISTSKIMEIKEKATETAKTDPEQAVQICSQLSGGYKTECLINVARIANDISICDDMEGTGSQDNCYFTLATFNGNLDACSLITDDNLRNSCDSLAKLKTMEITGSE